MSQWTNWCLCSCCVPITDVLDVAPANQLDFDLLSPGWVDCVFIIRWGGIGEEHDDEKKCEVLRTIQLVSYLNGVSSSQDVCNTQDESRCVWPHVAGVSHHPMMCKK